MCCAYGLHIEWPIALLHCQFVAVDPEIVDMIGLALSTLLSLIMLKFQLSYSQAIDSPRAFIDASQKLTYYADRLYHPHFVLL